MILDRKMKNEIHIGIGIDLLGEKQGIYSSSPIEYTSVFLSGYIQHASPSVYVICL